MEYIEMSATVIEEVFLNSFIDFFQWHNVTFSLCEGICSKDIRKVIEFMSEIQGFNSTYYT